MVMEAALLIGGMVATIAIGGPIVTGMVRPHLYRKAARRDASPGRSRSPHQAAFTPMDLGPDPMEWPSARPWGGPEARTMDWPSKEWDDEHFGTHWRKSTRSESPRRRSDSPPPARRPIPPPRPELGDDAAEASAKRFEETLSSALPVPRVPDRAEIEHLIAQRGLAGTVQVIMQRTGWDFRKAARFLKKTREG